MFDPQTEERLRRLLNLAAHPHTSQSERENALNGVRALLFRGNRTHSAEQSTSSAFFDNLRALTHRVTEDLIYAVISAIHSSRLGGKRRELAEALEHACSMWIMYASAHTEFDVRTCAMKLLVKLEDGVVQPSNETDVKGAGESGWQPNIERPRPLEPKREWRRI